MKTLRKHLFYQYNFFLAILISIITTLTFSPESHAAKSALYDSARDSYHSLIRSEKKKKMRHNWENTIDRFLKVSGQKGDPKAPDATFMVGELYKMLYTYSSIKSDLDKSIEYYNMVAAKYPNDSLADDSLYKIGGIYEIKLKDRKKAYVAYDRVTRQYPKGDMISKARSKLIRLKKYAPGKQVAKRPNIFKKKPGSPGDRPKKPKKAVPIPDTSNLIVIDDIKYWSGNDNTRVVIYPKKSIDYKYSFLGANKKSKAPPRLYIDLYNTKLDKQIKGLVEIKDGLLKAIRSDQHDYEVVRVVLDIERIENYRIFTFEDPFRIVVDVSGESTDKTGVSAKKAPKKKVAKKKKDDDLKIEDIKKVKNLKDAKKIVKKIQKKLNPEFDSKKNGTKKSKLTLAKQLGLGIKKIVIDPGHGGKDPGAVGVNKIQEADITLKISKKLKAIIEKNLDCKVILTREKDKTVSLEERTAIAKKVKADIFISIHTNASERGNARGIETYFLNYATNEHAMKTAARENATSKMALSDLENIVKIIRYSNVAESRDLAKKVQRAAIKMLSKKYKTKDLGVKQAPFYVLFGSKKPSILIETAFIDHKTEGRLLQSDEYITALAKSIYNGISNYIDGFNVAKN